MPGPMIRDDFEFDRVPPGQLQITYRQPVPNPRFDSWNNRPLQQVTLKPSQTLEANIVAPERAAPEDSKDNGLSGKGWSEVDDLWG